MPGILFLLHRASHDRIERLWDQMEREFGVAKGYPGALPTSPCTSLLPTTSKPPTP